MEPFALVVVVVGGGGALVLVDVGGPNDDMLELLLPDELAVE